MHFPLSFLWRYGPSFLLPLVLVGENVKAQRMTFNWTATNDYIVEQDEFFPVVKECSSVNITLYPLDDGTFDVVPPFYMLSGNIGGAVVVDPLHGENNTLVWDAVPHGPGSAIVTYILDSVGNWGQAHGFEVEAGSSPNCRPSVPFTPVNMTFDKIQVPTCDALTISLSGGEKPYTLTILGQEDHVIQNNTMGPNDDRFEFINRNPPGDGFFFLAADSKGQWSFFSTLIIGSTPANGVVNTTCNGRRSRSFQSNALAEGSSSSNVAEIVGGVIGGVVFLTAVVLVILFLRRKKQRVAQVERGEKINLAKDEEIPLEQGEAIPFVLPSVQSGSGPCNPHAGDSTTDVHDPGLNRPSSDISPPSQPPMYQEVISSPAQNSTPSMDQTQRPNIPGDAPLPAPPNDPVSRREGSTEEPYELPPEYRDRSRGTRR